MSQAVPPGHFLTPLGCPAVRRGLPARGSAGEGGCATTSTTSRPTQTCLFIGQLRHMSDHAAPSSLVTLGRATCRAKVLNGSYTDWCMCHLASWLQHRAAHSFTNSAVLPLSFVLPRVRPPF